MFILMPLMHSESIEDKDKLIDDSDKIGALKFGKRFAQAVKRWG